MRFPNSALLAFSILLCFCSLTLAQPKLKATAELYFDTETLKPGQQGIAAVVTQVQDGYHAQSSRPLDESLIPFSVKMTAEGPVTIDLPLYPPGHVVDYPALGGKISVYDGKVLTFIPFVVPADAPPGTVTFTAKARMQICDETMCDPPGELTLRQSIDIVAADAPTRSTHSEIFRQFDPIRYVNKHELTQTSSLAPTTAPSIAWIHYSDAELARLRATGKPVLVKFTAAWCVNCHVVERRVFGDESTLAELRRRGVSLVKVDITEQGAPGSDLLSSLNPIGSIPLTAIYFPGVEKPALLDGLYSSTDLFAKLDDAGKTASSLTTVFGIELTRSALPVTLGIAFLVGIVLNIVPCVLPVLPIKAVGFYEAAKNSRARSMLYGAVFSLGIISAFAVLALAVPIFGLNWGEWVSNRWFAGALTLVLLLAAAQSFGLLEFVLPASVNKFDASHDSIAGNFLWGLMTAVLSTPCTIGMFSAVITVALSLGTVLGMIVMIVVGAGMASPYFILSAFPEAARNFPRTGPWPNVVKQMMGFILVAIALFFIQPVLPASVRGNPVWWMIFACVAASAIFLLARTLQIAPRARPIAISSGISAVLVGAGLYLTLLLIS